MTTKTTYRIDRGGVERRIYGAKQAAKREAHTLVAQTLTDVPSTVAPQYHDWAYDLRRGRMTIYGSLLRFIDTLRARGIAKETALLIPRWIAAYIEDIYGEPLARTRAA